MTMVRTIAVRAVILGLTTVSATAEDYTFTGHIDNTWNNRLNWDPNDTGPPGAGDTATIPDGKICRVQEDDQEAHEVVVEEGGTLGIVSKDLTIDGGPANVHLTVDGTLYFKMGIEPRAPTPRLLTPDSALIIHGSGLVTARKAGGYGPGRIEADFLHVCSDATLAGSLQIYTDVGIVTHGTFVVDGSTDDMYVGRLSSSGSLPILNGSGGFRASNGTMHFGRVSFWWSLSGTWTICGGTIHVTEYCVCGAPSVQVTISDDGTLDLDTTFATLAGLDFGNGTIKLVAGEAALFYWVGD